MTEYSVGEIKLQAAKELRSGVHSKSHGMLLAYADLLEQIERAREGVTDEVVKAFRFARHEGCNKTLSPAFEQDKRALQSVAHLLPSERGVVEVSDKHEPDCNLNMASLKRQSMGCDCKQSVPFQKGRQPAQAAQVAVIGMLEPLVRELETMSIPDMELKHITLLGKFADASRKLISEAMNAPTAEPVAQGEAVGEIVPIYDPACSKVVLFNSDLPIGTKLYTAQPHAVPDQVRYALERCLLSQDALVCSIDKANPDDPYASLMVQEDIDVVRNWLSAPQSKEGAPAVNPPIDIAAINKVAEEMGKDGGRLHDEWMHRLIAATSPGDTE